MASDVEHPRRWKGWRTASFANDGTATAVFVLCVGRGLSDNRAVIVATQRHMARQSLRGTAPTSGFARSYGPP